MTPDGLRGYLTGLGAHVAALASEVDTISVEGLRRHLVAIAGTLDAVLGELALEAPRPAASGPAGAAAPGAACPHPEDDRQDAASLRNPSRFYCRRCGHLITEHSS